MRIGEPLVKERKKVFDEGSSISLGVCDNAPLGFLYSMHRRRRRLLKKKN